MAALVAFARSSLPHQTNRRLVLPPAVPPEPQAVSTSASAAIRPVIRRPVITPLLTPLLKRLKDRMVMPVIGQPRTDTRGKLSTSDTYAALSKRFDGGQGCPR